MSYFICNKNYYREAKEDKIQSLNRNPANGLQHNKDDEINVRFQ